MINFPQITFLAYYPHAQIPLIVPLCLRITFQLFIRYSRIDLFFKIHISFVPEILLLGPYSSGIEVEIHKATLQVCLL